jgi:hypothetical protein
MTGADAHACAVCGNTTGLRILGDQRFCEDLDACYGRRHEGRRGPARDTGTGLAGLGQRAILRQALSDAVAYRDPGGACTDCDTHPASLCADHAADLDKTDSYLALARSLGIELDDP